MVDDKGRCRSHPILRRDAVLTGSGRRRVDVGVFTPAEAAAALRQVLAERGHQAQPPGEVEALAAELGFLPLALSEAAAYITDAGLECAAYRTRLADRARSLADLLPRPAEGQPAGDTLPDGQAVTVAAAWSLSVDRADGLHPRGLARLSAGSRAGDEHPPVTQQQQNSPN